MTAMKNRSSKSKVSAKKDLENLQIEEKTFSERNENMKECT